MGWYLRVKKQKYIQWNLKCSFVNPLIQIPPVAQSFSTWPIHGSINGVIGSILLTADKKHLKMHFVFLSMTGFYSFFR